MRLAIISNVFPPHVIGGYELGCCHLARAAIRAGHDVRVLTSAAIGRLKKRCPAHDLNVRPIFKPVYFYESAISGTPSTDTAALFGGIDSGNVLSLNSELAAWRPDAIWIFNPLGLGPVGILETAISSGVPTALHLMDNLDQTVLDNQGVGHLVARWKRAKSRIGAIACSSKTLALNRMAGDFAAAAVIPNGIRLTDNRQRSEAPPGDRLRLVYFGQIERHKGVLQLIDALHKVRSLTPAPVELSLIGSGSSEFGMELEAYVRRRGLEGAVHRLGFMEPEALAARLPEMDAAVFPLSPDEPFAYVVIEAIRAGLPTIVTREAGCAECLPEEYPFLLRNRNDPAELASLIGKVTADWKATLRWRERARTSIEAKCDLDRSCLPAIIRFIASLPQREPIPDAVDRILSSLQTGIQDHLALHQSASRVRVGKRIERWIRSRIPSRIRHRAKRLVHDASRLTFGRRAS